MTRFLLNNNMRLFLSFKVYNKIYDICKSNTILNCSSSHQINKYFGIETKFITTISGINKTINEKKFELNRDGFKILTVFNEDFIEFDLDLENVKIGTKKLPYIWLRDNCKCSICFNFKTNEIDLDILSLPFDSKPINVLNKDENKTIEIICKFRLIFL
jgi:hypothetical protein